MHYQLDSYWLVECPIERVWDAIHDVAQWPHWWPYVKHVEKIPSGDDRDIGAVWRYTWATRLPYTIVFDAKTSRIEKPHVLQATVLGEVEGKGCWTLTTENEATAIHYRWQVDATKRWMRLLAPIARPVFVWNHHAVMKAGAEGLAKYLQARLLRCA
jgi:hypothetical protein